MDTDVFAAVRADGTGVDYAMHNKGVTPIFSYTEMIDHAASEKAGHAVSIAIETVTIMIAGDLLSAASHPVDDAIRARFPEAYRSWKAQQDGYVDGTPLSAWPLMSPARVRELQNVNIYSVEDLASVAETNLVNITDGRAMRDKAREHLAKETVQGREIDDLKLQMSEMAAMISRIAAKFEADEAPKSTRKGWPKGKPRKPVMEAVQTIEVQD
jgi:hypothetical protein